MGLMFRVIRKYRDHVDAPALNSIKERSTLNGILALIFDGNLEHVPHAERKVGLFGGNNRFVTALNRSNNRVCPFRAHLFLSYHLIEVPRFGIE